MSKTKNQNLKSEKIRVAPSLDSETHAMLIRLCIFSEKVVYNGNAKVYWKNFNFPIYFDYIM